MAFHRPIGIDHHDYAALLQATQKVPEKRIWLAYLVVHVDKEDAVEARLRKLRVLGEPEANCDIVQPFPLHPQSQTVAGFGTDILRKNAAGPSRRR